MLTLGPVWTGLVQQDIWSSDQTLGLPLPVCVQLAVISDLAEHFQKQAATQNGSSTDVAGTVPLPAPNDRCWT